MKNAFSYIIFMVYLHIIFQSLVEYLIDWTDVMNKMLTRCNRLVAKKKSSRSHWHPIFGWYSEPLDRRCFKIWVANFFSLQEFV